MLLLNNVFLPHKIFLSSNKLCSSSVKCRLTGLCIHVPSEDTPEYLNLKFDVFSFKGKQYNNIQTRTALQRNKYCNSGRGTKLKGQIYTKLNALVFARRLILSNKLTRRISVQDQL